MATDIFNRHEIKYMMPEETARKIITRLAEWMVPDEHNKRGSSYHICNIYYDTPCHDIIRKSIDKPVYKEKLRLRSYGTVGPNDKVYLEIKKKLNDRVNKRRTAISLMDACRFFEEGVKPEPESYLGRQIMNEIEFFTGRYELLPMVFISYDRYAFYGIEDMGFRVTFDVNIRSRRSDVRLDTGEYGEFLLPSDLWLMEVKTGRAVPLWFAGLMSEYELYPQPFSKYGTEYQKYITVKN